jgi:hypothetical protein
MKKSCFLGGQKDEFKFEICNLGREADHSFRLSFKAGTEKAL